jgi:hypothetical protein
LLRPHKTNSIIARNKHLSCKIPDHLNPRGQL